MKKFVYGIGFFVLFLALGAGFYTSYRIGASRGSGRSSGETVSEADGTWETEAWETAANSAVLDSHAVETETKSVVGYILKEENNRVVVYCADGTTLFEYTDILVSDLPYDLQSQLREGKEISGTAQLYSFLENYSS